MDVANASFGIAASVGLKGVNRPPDVITVQKLLNRNRHRAEKRLEIGVDGVVGPVTIGAIKLFQQTVVHMIQPDGHIDPNGPTLAALNAFVDGPGLHHPERPRAPANSPSLIQPICFPLRKTARFELHVQPQCRSPSLFCR